MCITYACDYMINKEKLIGLDDIVVPNELRNMPENRTEQSLTYQYNTVVRKSYSRRILHIPRILAPKFPLCPVLTRNAGFGELISAQRFACCRHMGHGLNIYGVRPAQAPNPSTQAFFIAHLSDNTKFAIMDKMHNIELSISTAHIETVQKSPAGIEYGPGILVDEKNQAQGDYSGATPKTDPAEIALVRKLDRRILPALCAMYFLNYVRSMRCD